MSGPSRQDRGNPADPAPGSNLPQDDSMAEIIRENRALLERYEEALCQVNTKTIEAELARIEFDQIFDAVADPLWVVDMSQEVVRINRSFLDLLGMKKKEFRGLPRKCNDLLHCALCGTPECPLQRIRKTTKRYILVRSWIRRLPDLVTGRLKNKRYCDTRQLMVIIHCGGLKFCESEQKTRVTNAASFV